MERERAAITIRGARRGAECASLGGGVVASRSPTPPAGATRVRARVRSAPRPPAHAPTTSPAATADDRVALHIGTSTVRHFTRYSKNKNWPTKIRVVYLIYM